MLLEQQLVNRFVTFAIKYGDFENEDAIYIQNRLLAILNAEGIDQNRQSLIQSIAHLLQMILLSIGFNRQLSNK